MGCVIRYASKADIDSIMRYIDEHWRKNHILSRDRELFEWQYGGVQDKLNMAIAEDGERICGILGFVPYDETDSKDIALALWKADSSVDGFLGLRLIRFLFDNEPHREVVCPGINPETTAKIYEYLNMKVGTMSHWYRLANRSKYHIAAISDRSIPPYEKTDLSFEFEKVDTVAGLEDIIDMGSEEYKDSIPYKSFSYIENRYFNHPLYNYHVYAFHREGRKANSAFVFRIQEHAGSKALRLIDCMGNVSEMRWAMPEIDKLMDGFDCEYIDVYEKGMSEDVMISSGWRRVTDTNSIIPDYFSPFEMKNIDIHYATSNEKAVLFKGDGDQDRPS